MNRVVAPQSTIATIGVLRFRPSRITLILKCDPVGVTSESTLELISLQKFETLSTSEAPLFLGDAVATGMHPLFKNPPLATSQSVLPALFAAPEAESKCRGALPQLELLQSPLVLP